MHYNIELLPKKVTNYVKFKGVIWCDFKLSFFFGVLQADCV